MLVIRNLRKNYMIGPTVVEVLKGIDLEVQQGDLLSIMGSSGSGKSTLMNILGLLDRPTTGGYFLEGRDVSHCDDDELSQLRNSRIGFVFQSFHLLPRMTVLENVGLPLIYRGLPEKEIREHSMAILEKVGMRDRMHHRPSELSGGQQQRVAIARALVGRPNIVLADEPTGALDSVVGQEIMDLFVKLNASERITIIIITHDAGVASQCRRQVRMRDGRLEQEVAP